ncbi:hypothetical protein [Solibacillus faecavium]|uniref:hypothetical protein n=1 Tax=Solibacillus faecavium TaxID=2762221 RepID=UPI001CD90563|nr:hypothetical protein [Solibacillus faecavium]
MNTLEDKNASGLDKGIALASFIPIGEFLKIPKAIDKIVDSNVGEVVKKSDVDEVVGKGKEYNNYKAVKYNGNTKINGEVRDTSRRVFQRRDIDYERVDSKTGKTNYQLMKSEDLQFGKMGQK